MSLTIPSRQHTDEPGPRAFDAVRTSTRMGLVFAACQILVAVAMAVFVLPHGGAVSDPAVERGRSIADAADVYRVGNYVFMLAGTLLLGFLGAVQHHLRALDRSGVLATVAVASGALLVVIWPMAGMLHDVALEAASYGTDPRLLAGWDAVAPYSLAFSALPRVFFVGAVLLALRSSGTAPWLVRSGIAVLVLSLVGSETLVSGVTFPVLALSTLAFEIWVGALAWHWLRTAR